MPGSSTHEAFEAFVSPLKDAFKCVARAKIEMSPGGRAVLDTKHSLYITGRANDGYLRLNSSRIELRARMFYMLITDDRPGYGPYRATTRGYDYSVRTTDRAAVVDYHWHPVGVSHEKRPHMHLGSTQLRPDAVLASKQHLLTGRITFESVIRDLIGMGVPALHHDWAELLDICEVPHVQHRSWSLDYESETGRRIDT
jgi:hypothetical protein